MDKPPLEYRPLPEPPPSRLALIACICSLACGPVACGLLLLMNRHAFLFSSDGLPYMFVASLGPPALAFVLGLVAKSIGCHTRRDYTFAEIATVAPFVWLIVIAVFLFWVLRSSFSRI